MDAQQLAQVEALCETLYTGVPTTGENGEQVTRNEAQQRLLSLQSSAEYIPQCQYILDNSSSQYPVPSDRSACREGCKHCR